MKLRLIACLNCHAQYDVSNIVAKEFPCRCGETIQNRELTALETVVQRCSACGALIQRDNAEHNCAYCGALIERDQRKLSLICPECFARNAENARFCAGCGVGFHPEAIQDYHEEVPCPACFVLMPPQSVAGIGINECGQCHGLWVPDDNFEILVSHAIEVQQKHITANGLLPDDKKPRVTGANPAQQSVQYRRCPVCNTQMYRRNYRKRSGVIIDTCGKHGTWLDADELERIAGFILSGGHLDAPPDKVGTPESIAIAMASVELQNLRIKSERQREIFISSTRTDGWSAGTTIVDLLFKLLG